MKKLLLLIFLTTTICIGQSKEERQAILDAKKNGTYNKKKDNKIVNETYAASNGVVYHVGDTITLGRGSSPNGDFNYLQMGGFYNTLSVLNGEYDDIASSIGRNYSGLNVEIKKIKEINFKGASKVIFVVGGGNITNYNLMIEDAISTCEIKNCSDTYNKPQIVYQKQEDKYDKLKKVKELLDTGVLTQEEFENEKKKLLESE
ncbi:SHOCT domain-containing protein [Flavivirga rizhaonensis]|uniref:SHOCT domain-containing protein n=1 Tax=Flavivirga rizhaonensis TaxID=2559571 RepID=A0A4S1DTW6_9FLAO|nr:SHOCT domain-containing protein [Flavivirga rizhaonensis]TGV01490.1 SHOCT domain-containing protein [Flavivirga rizhaonensis]